jgi:hypothetical protein
VMRGGVTGSWRNGVVYRTLPREEWSIIEQDDGPMSEEWSSIEWLLIRDHPLKSVFIIS